MSIPELRYLSSYRNMITWPQEGGTYDVFVSAYNESERVRSIFSEVSAVQKYWVLVPEYGYNSEEVGHLTNVIMCSPSESESTVIQRVIVGAGINQLSPTARLCFDITGFMRPQILFLLQTLWAMEFQQVAMLYTEPEKYARKEHTTFSREDVIAVRQVHGFEGTHLDELDFDVLAIGVGYDDALISRVVNDKDGARVIEMRGLPSLSADMYQESILRLDRTGINTLEPIFAPANDPFVVAHEMSKRVSEMRKDGTVGNLYLCPLGTKPQALGFGLFFMRELRDEPASVIFPYSSAYSRETSTGVGRTWVYELDLSEWKQEVSEATLDIFDRNGE